MDALHYTFNILKNIQTRINKKVIFISEDTTDRSRYFQWIPSKNLRQIFFQTLKSIDMAVEVSKATNSDIVFIFEHKPWYSYPLYLNCILGNKTVFFLVHGLQQTYANSIFHRIGFKVLLYIEKKYNFYPIHLEISDKDVVGIKKFSKSIVIPHPLPKEVKLEEKNFSKIKIGILGIIREDKPILPLINLLSKHHFDNAEILIGTSKYSIPPSLNSLPYQVFDTTSAENYNSFISSMHIIVNNFEKDQFYFRPSGIINDSIAGGCFVIAPNFPVFKAQVSNPVVVGELFNTLEEIPDIIKKAIVKIKTNNVDFKTWIDYRNDDKIQSELSLKILNILNKYA